MWGGDWNTNTWTLQRQTTTQEALLAAFQADQIQDLYIQVGIQVEVAVIIQPKILLQYQSSIEPVW